MNKTGRVIIVKRYTRELITANPNVIFVFEDNLARVGYGGQAKEARGCKNAVGIPTKISPSQNITDDLVYQNPSRYCVPVTEAFDRLQDHLKKDGIVCWPKDGVGTGLAALPTHAPKFLEGIEAHKERLFDSAVSVTESNVN